MSSLKNLGRVALALTATSLASALLVAACSSDNSNPGPTVFGDDGGNDATTGGGDDGSPEGSTSNPDGSGGNPDASPDSGPGGDAGDAGDGNTVDSAPSCTAVLSDAGCWTCPAQSDGSVEFLNQCSGTGVTCVSFDNLGRLPGFDAGLPHL